MIINLYYLLMKNDSLELSSDASLSLTTYAGLVTCERDWSWAPAPFADYDLWIVLGGRGWIILHGCEIALCAGSAFVFQPGDRIRGEHDPRDRLRVLYCHFRIQDGLGQAVNRPQNDWPSDDCVIMHDLSRIEMLGGILVENVRSARAGAQRAAELALRQLLLQRKMDARDDPPFPADKRITRVLAAIQAAPERAWTLAAMAQTVHMSVSQFRRLFHASTGLTPNAHLIQERVSRARVLLVESDLTIESIADTLGYSDVYYFSRQFRRATGVPPGRYRRTARHAGK